MDNNLDIQIKEALKTYLASRVEDQTDYQKFSLYSIVTHSTAIEGSTVTRSAREMKKLGFIQREGSDKTERWIILK